MESEFGIFTLPVRVGLRMSAPGRKRPVMSARIGALPEHWERR